MDRFGSQSARRAGRVVAAIIGTLTLTTLAVGVLEDRLKIPDASATYLLAVVLIAVAFGISAAVATAVGAFVVYDFVFVTPTGALVVADPQEWLNLVLLLALGVVVGQLAGMQRARAETAGLRERQALTQYRVGRELATATTAREALPALVAILRSEIDAVRVWVGLGVGVAGERVAADSGAAGRPVVPASYELLQRRDGDEATAWLRVHDPRPSSAEAHESRDACYRVQIATAAFPVGSIWLLRPRRAGPPGRGQARVLAAAADQIGQALERDRLAEEATSAEVARRSEAAKSALLDSVSHDLRTPLASIRAAAGSLMTPALDLDPGARHERAAAIDREADRLNRLVTNLLDMSRIEAGDLRARLEPFLLEDVVEATLERLGELLTGRPVSVAMREDLPPVQVDPVFIDQVLTNLLENAARHAPPGSSVRVHAASVDEEWVRLTIEDGGLGIPPEVLAHIFDKFSRASAAGGGSPPGAGIGLAVVRGLVAAMGGRVAARTSELGGLAIDVDLRAAPLPSEAEGTSHRAETGP
jgi:two-component system, OmpR family, sensor histidine kinase KdpD